MQFSHDYQSIQEAACIDLPEDCSPEKDFKVFLAALHDAINQAKLGRNFKGKDAVVCVHQRDLFLHSIRVGKQESKSLATVVQQEAAERVPYSMLDAEIRHIESHEIRHGEQTLREVIILACFRPRLESILDTCIACGLSPLSVDVEPAAILRAYTSQHRRESDNEDRVLYLHVGYSNSSVVIAEGQNVLFIKTIETGGMHFNHAVARSLDMKLSDASNLRKHNSDRRRSQQTPEVERSVLNAMRDELEKLQHELSMCIRYHSVTFRGKPLVRIIVSGGEANETLRGELQRTTGIDTELGDPTRLFNSTLNLGRSSQWDVAVGLALRVPDPKRKETAQ